MLIMLLEKLIIDKCMCTGNIIQLCNIHLDMFLGTFPVKLDLSCRILCICFNFFPIVM